MCKYGKFVQLFTGFNDESLTPIVQRIDPRFIYPYNDGTLLVKDYPFFGFDRVVSYDELSELKVANKFKDWVMTHYDEYIESIKVNDAFYRDINTFYEKETGMFTIHYHYTYIKKKLYRVLML